MKDVMHYEYVVANDVEHELCRQRMKWGEQNHEPNNWMLILAEEFGEAAKEANELTFRKGDVDAYYDELIQVAAVAINAARTVKRSQRNRSGAV